MKYNSLVFWSYTEKKDILKQEGAIKETYGYSRQEFQNNKNLWYDVIYPDDKKYLDLSIQSLDNKSNKEISVKYRIVHKSGRIKSLLGSIKKEELDGDTLYSGYNIDLSRHQNVSIVEEHGENLTSFIEYSISELYDLSGNRKKKLDTVLGKLAELLKVDLITVFKAGATDNDELKLIKNFEWATQKIQTQYTKSGFEEKIDLQHEFPTLHDYFINRKKPVNEIVSLLPQKEKSYFKEYGIKSILAIPIFFNGSIWGFINYLDYKVERYWSHYDTQILKIFGTVLMTSEEYENSIAFAQNKVEQLKNLKVEREQFLKMLSHQFKTPLSIIELNLSMIDKVKNNLNEKDSKRFQKKVDRMKRSVEKMKELIETILIGTNYTSIEGTPDTINLYDIITHRVQNHNKHNNFKIDLNFNVSAKQRIATLPFQIDKLEYIIDSILSNAIKYSACSKKPIQFVVSVIDTELVLKVTDYGMGINENDIEKIGTPFFRGRNVADISGSGITLSMVKETLKAVNGEFQIQSKIGKYTSVKINIPVNF